ncbi:MAG TPA: DUF433 domain-containing protein [Blastocatellia bacterium]|nr:DUF433 domain-containing protein [Blastocatellia bacterium]
MSAMQEIEKLLSGMSRSEKAQLLQLVVRDLGDAFPGIEASPEVCGGEPRIVRTRIPVWVMHIVGDSAYWTNKDRTIDKQDANVAIVVAANEVGAKYVDQQVYKALRSSDYRSILSKIAKMGPDSMSFSKGHVVGLTEVKRRSSTTFFRR